MPQITPYLMFNGRAKEALALYCECFPDAEVTQLETYGPEGPGQPGTIKLARFTLAEQAFMAIDSPTGHDFDFTPAHSFFVECVSAEQQCDLLAQLAEGGHVLMPLDNYGFSEAFTWITDRFGVSWQLNFHGTHPA
ncbi:VOC family protein [Simiduia aestuariiviva]|uniref:Putative 3-demethylubiquinone-9 3-methyltransferase (Glyoxalase superfamily) n=1 Tax=Simiduia aestuariiviva TaxID=1510459 RepID=A0A839UPL7_9GAMM|nr:VOC family protein [Simiduia aestuariiviva]MBB3167325.1 putative 3-demethylubiquinone-9 3-methyltransferase (glyoxalase superfamily) [Simiduia aestuariiviva]